MASESGVNPGKTAFLATYLPSNRNANLEEATKAWNEAGNPGTLSESLFSKIRSKLGLTAKSGTSGASAKKAAVPSKKGAAQASGKRAVVKPRKTSSKAAAKQASMARKPETAGTSAKPQAETKPAAKPKSIERQHVLDRVEDKIDDLILELKQIGGMDAALESFRKVRRVIVRSHDG